MDHRQLTELLTEAYRRGYNDRNKETDYDPGHALDLLEHKPRVPTPMKLESAESDYV